MKKILAILLTVLVCGVLFSGCGGNAAAPHKGTLLMATTTSTDNTGLLDYLAPRFLHDTGWDLKWTAVGSGEAIQLGRDGQADVLLVHSPAAEKQLVSDGFGVERIQVMYNDYVIAGPADGPVKPSNDAVGTFKQIMDGSLTFISRGDNSGTNTAEINLWKKAGIENYDSNPNYISAGAGMGATLVMANEKQGYTLSDRGTWLSTRKNADNGITLTIVCEKDPALFNQYSVIAVSPDKYPDINNEAANAFIDWITSAPIQQFIGEFGVADYGQQLFVPNANAK